MAANVAVMVRRVDMVGLQAKKIHLDLRHPLDQAILVMTVRLMVTMVMSLQAETMTEKSLKGWMLVRRRAFLPVSVSHSQTKIVFEMAFAR